MKLDENYKLNCCFVVYMMPVHHSEMLPNLRYAARSKKVFLILLKQKWLKSHQKNFHCSWFLMRIVFNSNKDVFTQLKLYFNYRNKKKT